MKLKSILLASACTLGLGGAAFAFDQSMIDTIAAELAAQGYTKLEVKIGPNGAKVEATGPNGAVERYYDNDGNLIREEQDNKDGSSADDYDDDDRDDDHDDDDRDEDDRDDDDDGDDDEDDDDHDDDDDDDDDEDDDDDDDEDDD